MAVVLASSVLLWMLGYGLCRASGLLVRTESVLNAERYGRITRIEGAGVLRLVFWPLVQVEERIREARR